MIPTTLDPHPQADPRHDDASSPTSSTTTYEESQSHTSTLPMDGVLTDSVEPFSFPRAGDIDAFLRGLQEKKRIRIGKSLYFLLVPSILDLHFEPRFVQPLQTAFPNGLILGGVGDSAYVPFEAHQVLHDARLRQRLSAPILASYDDNNNNNVDGTLESSSFQ